MTNPKKSKISRREFLIGLGGVVGASVVGWIAVPKVVKLFTRSDNTTSYPGLLDCLQIRDTNLGTELIDVSDPSTPTLVCQVNQIGGTILHELNGRNSLEDIAKATANSLSEEVSDIESFTGRVALFISKIAEAGFIKEPFFVKIIEKEYIS